MLSEAPEADALLATAVMSEDGRQDPYPIYARMRAEFPRWRSLMGVNVLTRYEDCLEVLRHPHLGRAESDMADLATFSGRPTRVADDSVVMLFLNPPDHTRIRGLVSRAFTHIRPLVHAAARLIDAAADEETLAQGELATGQLAQYFQHLAARKRRSPDEGLFSALIRLEAEGDRLSEEELIGNTILLYAAGFETTSNLIGNGLRLLLGNPEQTARVRADPILITSAVWEMLRHDSPVQLNVRVVLQQVELLGEVLPRGTQFLILQGSANHDETHYTRPERFNVTRFAGDNPAPTPLTFGWGAHHCLGAHLARAEGEVVFSALLERFSHIELDTAALDAAGHQNGSALYRPSFTLRGLQNLPITVAE